MTDLEIPDKQYCGDAFEESVERGCHWEPMIFCWVPDLCYTSEPLEGYDPFSQAIWHTDRERQHPLTDEEMAGFRVGSFTIAWTSLEYHQQHCLYLSRKLARAVNQRVPYTDSKTASFHHSQHCANLSADYIHDQKAFGIMYGTAAVSSKRGTVGCVKLF